MRKWLLIVAAGLVMGGSKDYSIKLGLIKYNGGGDWYANPTALPNLAEFANKTLHANIDPSYSMVELGSTEIFNYPFLHLTGHGNVIFSAEEVENLRLYLEAGGFLHIDDNYGLDPFIRREMKKVFPDKDLEAISPKHEIFNQYFEFPEGLPKIHLHDNEPPEAWGYYVDDRLAVFYTHESDLGDGWENPKVHNDPIEKHETALKMGLNILVYALNNP